MRGVAEHEIGAIRRQGKSEGGNQTCASREHGCTEFRMVLVVFEGEQDRGKINKAAKKRTEGKAHKAAEKKFTSFSHLFASMDPRHTAD